jgi:hypothetical protein
LALNLISTITRQKLDWNPVGPKLIADLRGMDYSKLTG